MPKEPKPLYEIGEQVFTYSSAQPRVITERIFTYSPMTLKLGAEPHWYYRVDPYWGSQEWVPEHALHREQPQE